MTRRTLRSLGALGWPRLCACSLGGGKLERRQVWRWAEHHPNGDALDSMSRRAGVVRSSEARGVTLVYRNNAKLTGLGYHAQLRPQVSLLHVCRPHVIFDA